MNISEKNSKLVSALIQIIIFVICMVLIVKGHAYGRLNVDIKGGLIATGVMLLGLIGILGILFFYNKKYK